MRELKLRGQSRPTITYHVRNMDFELNSRYMETSP